jgi:hypothetical protein
VRRRIKPNVCGIRPKTMLLILWIESTIMGCIVEYIDKSGVDPCIRLALSLSWGLSSNVVLREQHSEMSGFFRGTFQRFLGSVQVAYRQDQALRLLFEVNVSNEARLPESYSSEGSIS